MSKTEKLSTKVLRRVAGLDPRDWFPLVMLVSTFVVASGSPWLDRVHGLALVPAVAWVLAMWTGVTGIATVVFVRVADAASTWAASRLP